MVIHGTGHWVAEMAPEEMLAALTAFVPRAGTNRRRPGAAGDCLTAPGLSRLGACLR